MLRPHLSRATSTRQGLVVFGVPAPIGPAADALGQGGHAAELVEELIQLVQRDGTVAVLTHGKCQRRHTRGAWAALLYHGPAESQALHPFGPGGRY